MENIGNPQKVPFVFNVGTVGHKNINKELAQKIRMAVSGVLNTVNKMISAHHDHFENQIYNPTPPCVRCISSLSRGADHLIARASLELGFQLQCVLPFFQFEYVKDFIDDESKNEFENLLYESTSVFENDGSRYEDTIAYLNASNIILEHSDLLITIWDGSIQGDDNIINNTVQEAIKRKILVIIIKPDNPTDVQCLAGHACNDWQRAVKKLICSIMYPFVSGMSVRPKRSSWMRCIDFFVASESDNITVDDYFNKPLNKFDAVGSSLRLLNFAFEKMLSLEINMSAKNRSLASFCNEILYCLRNVFIRHFLVSGKSLAEKSHNYSCVGVERAKFAKNKTLFQHYLFTDYWACYYKNISQASGLIGVLLKSLIFVQILLKHRSVQSLTRKYKFYRELSIKLKVINLYQQVGHIPSFLYRNLTEPSSQNDWTPWLLHNLARFAGLPSVCVNPKLLEGLFIDSIKNTIEDLDNFYDLMQHKNEVMLYRLNKIISISLFVTMPIAIITMLWVLLSKLLHGLNFCFDEICLSNILTSMAITCGTISLLLFSIRTQGAYGEKLSYYRKLRISLNEIERHYQQKTCHNSSDFLYYLDKLSTLYLSAYF